MQRSAHLFIPARVTFGFFSPVPRYGLGTAMPRWFQPWCYASISKLLQISRYAIQLNSCIEYIGKFFICPSINIFSCNTWNSFFIYYCSKFTLFLNCKFEKFSPILYPGLHPLPHLLPLLLLLHWFFSPIPQLCRMHHSPPPALPLGHKSQIYTK